MKRERTIEYLKYTFSDEEKKDLAMQMAQTSIKKDSLEQQKTAVTKQFASDIAQAGIIIQSCASKIESGYEMRQIDCEEEPDFEKRILKTYRTDTGELVKTRPLRSDEMQKSLFDEMQKGLF